MTNREFFPARRKAESPVFQSVLRALPVDRMDYKPHEKSPSAQQRVWTLTAEVAACTDLIDTDGIDWNPAAKPPSLEEMIALFDRRHVGLEGRVRKLDDMGWTRDGQFRSGDKVMMESPMGEKVPSIYGPSADTRGQ